ncbi:hypothetical protein FWF89_00310 [Candidatus Saccharibacteria bacterium]|nr:hypothetical protein [Candidatus Saccharibacteria bacterium]
MLWIFLAVSVAAAASISAFIDNYITDVHFKGRLPQAQKILGLPAYLLICLIIAAIFPIQALPLHFVLIFIGTGIMSALGSIAYYKALSTEDTTGTTIFIQLAPVLYLIAGWTLLGDHISLIQILAFALLVAAPLIVIFFSQKRAQKLRRRGAFLIILYLLFVVTANIIFVSATGGEGKDHSIDFYTAFFYAMMGKLMTDTALTLIFRSWRKRFKWVVKNSGFKFLGPMIINELLYVSMDLIYRLALTIGPIALVSATANSLQLIITFFLGIVLTLIWPIFGRERLRARTIIAHLIATAFAVTGIILLG